MRETRNAQISIFQFYSEHTLGKQLRALSDLLGEHPQIIELIEQDFRVPDTAATGACGLSIESVFRCLDQQGRALHHLATQGHRSNSATCL